MKTLKNLENIIGSNKVFKNIKNHLKNKYNFSENDEIFDITQNELNAFKILLENNDLQKILNFIDNELIQTNLQKEIFLLNNEIDNIDNEIEKNNQLMILSEILVGNYKNIKHWDDIFNIGDINDVLVNDIINEDDFGEIIGKTIGKNDYKKIDDYSKKLLNILFSNIKDFHIYNNISPFGEVKDFLKNYKVDFQKYFINKISEFDTSL